LGNTWETIKFIDNGAVHFAQIDPINTETIFIVHNNSKKEPYSVVVIKSTDRGRTWEQIYSKNLPENPNNQYKNIITGLIITEEQIEQAMYLGTSYGLQKSVDKGLTWETIGGIK